MLLGTRNCRQSPPGGSRCHRKLMVKIEAQEISLRLKIRPSKMQWDQFSSKPKASDGQDDVAHESPQQTVGFYDISWVFCFPIPSPSQGSASPTSAMLSAKDTSKPRPLAPEGRRSTN